MVTGLHDFSRRSSVILLYMQSEESLRNVRQSSREHAFDPVKFKNMKINYKIDINFFEKLTSVSNPSDFRFTSLPFFSFVFDGTM